MKIYKKIVFLLILLILTFACTEKTATDHIDAGIQHTRNQNYDKAISSFKKAIELEPDNALANYSLGGMYTYKNMYEKAIFQYKKAIELDPVYADPHYSLGFVYEKMGKEKESKSEYRLFELLKVK